MQFYILLTEKCNLNCPMCIRGKQDGQEMDFERIKVLPFTDTISQDVVILTGGEPTFHPHFEEIVRFFASKCRLVVITTNGTTGYDFEKLSGIHNIHIQVSVDGDEKSHDAIRGQGNFRRSFTCVENLDSLSMKYSIATVASRKNMTSLDNLISSISKLNNMAYWKVSYEMPFETKDYNDMLSADEWNSLVNHLISITPFKLKIQKIFPIELYDAHFEELLETVGSRCHNCGGGTDKVYIYPDFNVYPCTCLTDFPVGNLLTESIQDILDSKMMKLFSDYQIIETSKCNNCKYKKLCNGGCIGMSYHYFGRLGMGDVRCPLI